MKRKRNNINVLRGFVLVAFVVYYCFSVLVGTLEDETKRTPFLIIIALILSITIIYKLIKSLIIKRIDINYIREIPKKYSLPVIAYLYKYSINLDSIITAMILKLKNMNLIKESNKTIYALDKQEELNKLSTSEMYLYKWITSVNKKNYSFKQFKELLIKELEQNRLINKKTPAHFVELVFGLMVVLVIVILRSLGYISYEIFMMFVAIGLIGLLAFFIISGFMPYKSYQYSKKGYKEHYAVLGFYKFLKEFTNLAKRNMEERIIWEEYLEFAVLFNINHNYEFTYEYQFLTQSEILDALEKMGEDSRD